MSTTHNTGSTGISRETLHRFTITFTLLAERSHDKRQNDDRGTPAVLSKMKHACARL
jgi:hypothetical protein